ncbi:G protein-coupled glucose receptor regulating Gpa2-domain-containing protein [Paraphoma chrysanthemicola]|uniref:G protein-coupled glucose receptor regulating Gpa2-domain-containing protein n=1 Tax=Paraphoma chrysanthemicola TaxID=798071 RepID=A0A8K0R824_9PLEO|nr:G protein-coupled glucose receptor regulating Gpa2-domain-containing protein [Paraphoma chrysanthemicola]
MALSPNSAWTSSEARDLQQTYQVQLAALVCSGLSIVACIIAFYWFSRMAKLFRHRLIMCLVYGDLMRNTWYFVFAMYSLARGRVQTESKFCQCSGFLIQYGTETSDYAVLVMAIHSALQVFRPASFGPSDGLYQYRYYVYFGGLALPIIAASLAFVNPDPAYLSLGAFCTLPIRPFWYRLALSWIPRYLIALTIIILAIAIYAYVGFEFRAYANLNTTLRTPTSTTTGMSQCDAEAGLFIQTATTTSEKEPMPDNTRRTSSVAHDVISSHRRGSNIAFGAQTPFTHPADISHTSVYSQSLPSSATNLPLQRNLSVRPPLFVIPSGYTVKPPDNEDEQEGPLSPTSRPVDDPLASLTRRVPNTDHDRSSSNNASPTSATQHHLHRERTRIHRQLRLMFIYPLVYTLMWLIPFVQHCMMYDDYQASHPIFWIRIVSTICQMILGFVDCLIFSMREKPWRSIQNSDGSFWGSFAIWRNSRLASVSSCGLVVGSMDGAGMEASMAGSMSGAGGTNARRSVRTSASDDQTKLAVEQARARLDLEREDRLERMRKLLEERAKADEERASWEEEGGRSGEGNGAVQEPKGKEKLVGPVVDDV